MWGTIQTRYATAQSAQHIFLILVMLIALKDRLDVLVLKYVVIDQIQSCKKFVKNQEIWDNFEISQLRSQVLDQLKKSTRLFDCIYLDVENS